jgi:hypothetical protein
VIVDKIVDVIRCFEVRIGMLEVEDLEAGGKKADLTKARGSQEEEASERCSAGGCAAIQGLGWLSGWTLTGVPRPSSTRCSACGERSPGSKELVRSGPKTRQTPLVHGRRSPKKRRRQIAKRLLQERREGDGLHPR